MTRAAALALLLLAGCGRASDLEGPAPEGALACAVAFAEDAGYEIADGGIEEGSVRLVQRVEPGPGPVAPDLPDPDLAGGPVEAPRRPVDENEILASVEEGRMRLSVLRSVADDDGPPSGGTAMEHARTMLALCSTSPSAQP